MYKRLNSMERLIQRTTTEAPPGHMDYSGLDVHKKTISYRVKDASGQIHQQGKMGATRFELNCWMKTLSPALDRGHGGNDFHRLDLRSSASACGTGQSGASTDATRHGSRQEKERSD